MFVVEKRVSLLMPTEDSGRMHLFVVLRNPAGPQRLTVIVQINSARPGKKYDRTCMLHAGEHEFIKHPSYVNYRKCRLEFAEVLERGIKSGRYKEKARIDAGLFERILAGAARSKSTRQYVKEYL